MVHQLIGLMTVEESRLAKLRKQKKEEEEESDTKDATPTPQEPAGGLGGLSGLSGLSGLGGLGSLFGAPSPKSPKPEEEAAKAKEDSEFQLKMLVLGIALVAAGEGVNEAMVTRTLELFLVYGSKSVTEVVLLAFALLHLSAPTISIMDQMMRKTAGGRSTNKTNTSAYRVAAASGAEA